MALHRNTSEGYILSDQIFRELRGGCFRDRSYLLPQIPVPLFLDQQENGEHPDSALRILQAVIKAAAESLESFTDHHSNVLSPTGVRPVMLTVLRMLTLEELVVVDSVFSGAQLSEFLDRTYNSKARLGKVVYRCG